MAHHVTNNQEQYEHNQRQEKRHTRGGHGGFGLGAKVEKPKNSGKTFRRLLGEIAFAKGRIIAVTIAAVVATILTIAAPLVLAAMTDELFSAVTESRNVDFALIGKYLVLLAGLYLASSIFTYAQHYVMSNVTQQMVLNLRKKVRLKFDRLPVAYYDSHPHGDILSRVTNDLDLVATTLKDSIIQALTALITIIGVIFMMLRLSPLLTLVALLTLPLTVLATAGVASRSRSLFQKRQDALGVMNAHIEETFSGHEVMKAFGRRNFEIEQFKQENEAYYTYAQQANFISGIIRPLVNFVGNLGFVGIVTVGAVLVLRNSITVGVIQAFIQYLRNLNMPIQRVAGIINTIQSTLAASERVFTVLDQEEIEHQTEGSDISSEKPVELQDCNKTTGTGCGRVVFEDVTFAYEPGQPVIHNFSLTAEPGERIAIVGPTGAGKSTIVNLLMRFYEVDEGAIMVDGVNINDLPREQLRNMTGMVLQDVWLRDATVAENIAFGAANIDDVTREEIENVAQLASADSFIRALPEGYDTVIGEGAMSLSSGQRQLITIARAFIKDPSILILDEATSMIDTQTERAIQEAGNRVLQNRTSFVIAHRLSTIQDADRIIVLRDGRIAEQGTHDELLKRDGFYAELYHSGFSACDDAIMENKAV